MKHLFLFEGVSLLQESFSLHRGTEKSIFGKDLELETKKLIAESSLPEPVKRTILYGALSNLDVDVGRRAGPVIAGTFPFLKTLSLRPSNEDFGTPNSPSCGRKSRRFFRAANRRATFWRAAL